MKVRYTRSAFKQLSAILDYIDARSPQGAKNVKRRIQAAVDMIIPMSDEQRTAPGSAASSRIPTRT